MSAQGSQVHPPSVVDPQVRAEVSAPETHKKRPTETYRPHKEELLTEASEEVRNILRYELNAAISHFIQRDQPVYLEGLGILFPEIHTERRSEVEHEIYYIWSETFRTVVFEKCCDLIAMHREKFSDIVETKELVQWIYPRLPLYISSRWAERDIRRLVRAAIEVIRHQIVDEGHSAELSSVGDLFALHNRQGRSHGEWYAGADIFLCASWHQVISASKKKVFERPVLSNAWELFEAAYGPALLTFEISLAKELREMGYDPSLLPAGQDQLRVAAFKSKVEGQGSGTFIFCTEGLRVLGLNSKHSKGYGSELVFQLSEKGVDAFAHGSNEVPQDLARRPLTAGWMLLQSAPSRSVRPGAGLGVEVPLYGNSSSSKMGAGLGQRATISTIFTTTFHLMRDEQISASGPFRYTNIVGIADDEAALAAKYSPQYLLSLLEHRSLTQISTLYRPSLLLRTELTHRLGRRAPGVVSSFMQELPAESGEDDLLASAS
jgi:hypothetical protein